MGKELLHPVPSSLVVSTHASLPPSFYQLQMNMKTQVCFLLVKCIRWYFKLLSKSFHWRETEPQNDETSVFEGLI